MQESLGSLLNSPEMLLFFSFVLTSIVYKFLEAYITTFVGRKMGAILFTASVYDRGMTIRHDTSIGAVTCVISDVDSKNIWLDYGTIDGAHCLKPIPLYLVPTEMTKWSVLNYKEAPKE